MLYVTEKRKKIEDDQISQENNTNGIDENCKYFKKISLIF